MVVHRAHEQSPVERLDNPGLACYGSVNHLFIISSSGTLYDSRWPHASLIDRTPGDAYFVPPPLQEAA